MSLHQRSVSRPEALRRAEARRALSTVRPADHYVVTASPSRSEEKPSIELKHLTEAGRRKLTAFARQMRELASR
jgi:hypothetical protein